MRHSLPIIKTSVAPVFIDGDNADWLRNAPDDDLEGRDEREVEARGYAATEKMLDLIESHAAKMLRDAFRESRDALLELVLRDYAPESTSSNWINSISIKKWSGVQLALGELLRGSFMLGARNTSVWIRGQAGEMKPHRARRPGSRGFLVPKEGLKYFENKKLVISGALKEEHTQAAKVILLDAMKRGEGVNRTAERLRALFEPLVGEDSPLVQPARLRTIVRTNATDAYNQGVLYEYRSEELMPLVKAVRYTSVLDSRTTEICNLMHGTLFRKDDPRLDELTPPNHFNCRSILEPVTVDEKVGGGSYLTNAKHREAMDLKGDFR